MYSRHSGRTQLSALLTIGINPLPFRQNNKPAAPKEELIAVPKNTTTTFVAYQDRPSSLKA